MNGVSSSCGQEINQVCDGDKGGTVYKRNDDLGINLNLVKNMREVKRGQHQTKRG